MAKGKAGSTWTRKHLPEFTGDFTLQSCDFSLHCSGLALLQYHSANRTVSIIKKLIIPTSRSIPIGQAASDLFDRFSDFIAPRNIDIYIRERPIIWHSTDTDRLLRVAGVIDVALWKIKRAVFYDFMPSSIKLTMAGNGRAGKEAVADALTKYVGPQEYETDDESDAVAVGVTYLIREGYIDDKRPPKEKKRPGRKR